jgi:hypothetical protein
MGASQTQAGSRRCSYSDPWRTCGMRSSFLFQVVALDSARVVIGSSRRPGVSELASALRARPADPVLVAEDRSARGVRDQSGPEPRSVRAGSAAERRTVDNSGHERTPNVHRNRRSSHLQDPDLGRRRPSMWSSSLPNHAVMILGGDPFFASVGLPTLRPPRLVALARPAPAPDTCEPPAHRQPAVGAWPR